MTATTTIVVMGVSGSGKTSVMTSLGGLLGWPTAEGDDFHPDANVAKMRAGQTLDDADRRPWLDLLAAWIGAREAGASDAILTCSALKRSYRDRLRHDHPSVWFAHLVAPRDVLAGRMTTRSGHFMPASLLDSQLATLEPLAPDEPGRTFSTMSSPPEIAAEIVAELWAVGRLR
jgi:gluconokinase